ncbi:MULTISPECIES: hypothetical protein [Okeania]|nr:MULTISPECIES: hypothetical protein [Okeania]
MSILPARKYQESAIACSEDIQAIAILLQRKESVLCYNYNRMM